MAGSQGPQSIQEGYRALLADIAALSILPDADPKFLMTLQAAIVQKARMGAGGGRVAGGAPGPPGAVPGSAAPGGPTPPGGGPGMPGQPPGGGAANPAMPTLGAPLSPGAAGPSPGLGATGMNSPDEIRRVIAANAGT